MAAAKPFLRGKVLDFGCGTGALAGLWPAADYAGVDHDPESLAKARAMYPGHAFFDTPPPNSVFDTIACLAVIEHVPHPADLLQSLSRLLAPSGRMVLTSPHPGFEMAYKAGARLGLFSRHAEHDHQALINQASMRRAASQASLEMVFFRRFLLGANQIFVLRHKNGA